VSEVEPEFLARMARKYIWWKRAPDAVARPDRVIAQVMDIGEWRDVMVLAEQAGDARLADVLANAEIGQFTPRSWAYWHYRLGRAPAEAPPPMPKRRVG